MVRYDEDGVPFILCASNQPENQKVYIKKCTLPDGSSELTADVKELACFTLGRGEAIIQDCWVHQAVSCFSPGPPTMSVPISTCFTTEALM